MDFLYGTGKMLASRMAWAICEIDRISNWSINSLTEQAVCKAKISAYGPEKARAHEWKPETEDLGKDVVEYSEFFFYLQQPKPDSDGNKCETAPRVFSIKQFHS